MEGPETVLWLSELETPYQKKGFETGQGQVKLFFSLGSCSPQEVQASQGGSRRSGRCEVASLGGGAAGLGAVAELELEFRSPGTWGEAFSFITLSSFP